MQKLRRIASGGFLRPGIAGNRQASLGCLTGIRGISRFRRPRGVAKTVRIAIVVGALQAARSTQSARAQEAFLLRRAIKMRYGACLAIGLMAFQLGLNQPRAGAAETQNPSAVKTPIHSQVPGIARVFAEECRLVGIAAYQAGYCSYARIVDSMALAANALMAIEPPKAIAGPRADDASSQRLIAELRSAKATAAPVTPAEFDAARADLDGSLGRLQQYLGATSTGWNQYLHTDELRTELAKGRNANPAALREVAELFRSGAEGLELPQFVSVRRAIRH